MEFSREQFYRVFIFIGIANFMVRIQNRTQLNCESHNCTWIKPNPAMNRVKIGLIGSGRSIRLGLKSLGPVGTKWVRPIQGKQSQPDLIKMGQPDLACLGFNSTRLMTSVGGVSISSGYWLYIKKEKIKEKTSACAATFIHTLSYGIWGQVLCSGKSNNFQFFLWCVWKNLGPFIRIYIRFLSMEAQFWLRTTEIC